MKTNKVNIISISRGKHIYFNGDCYKVIKAFPVQSKSGDLSYPENIQYYSYEGRNSNYIANSKERRGIKIFTNSASRQQVELIYKIQNILYKEGLAKKAYEIITCHDGSSSYYAIKTDTIRGKFHSPDSDWKSRLQKCCNKNNLIRLSPSIMEELKPGNCIKEKGKLYLVDIDQKWQFKKI